MVVWFKAQANFCYCTDKNNHLEYFSLDPWHTLYLFTLSYTEPQNQFCPQSSNRFETVRFSVQQIGKALLVMNEFFFTYIHLSSFVFCFPHTKERLTTIICLSRDGINFTFHLQVVRLGKKEKLCWCVQWISFDIIEKTFQAQTISFSCVNMLFWSELYTIHNVENYL